MAAQIEREGSDAVSCVAQPSGKKRDVALSPRQLEAGSRPDHSPSAGRGIATAAPFNNPGNAHTGNLGVIQPFALRWRGVARLSEPKTRCSD